MPDLRPVDDAFFDTAPIRGSETFRIARPASEVWSELVGEKPLDWCRALSIRWTSPKPYGVGTTRRAKVLGGALALDEHFYTWDEGERMSFYVTRTNLPLLAALGEDYVVTPDGDGACTLRWTIAAEPTKVGKPAGPTYPVLFKWIFADTRRHFAAS